MKRLLARLRRTFVPSCRSVCRSAGPALSIAPKDLDKQRVQPLLVAHPEVGERVIIDRLIRGSQRRPGSQAMLRSMARAEATPWL